MSPLQKRFLLLVAMCLAMQASVNLIMYFHGLSDGSRFGGDFICFWNAAHRVRQGDIASIYEPDTWHRILSTNEPGVISWFVYPPFTLFALWPLGGATYNEAVLAWSLVPLAFYFALIVLLAKRSGLGAGANPACDHNWPRTQACAVLIAFSLPFLGANLFCGQTGALIAVFFLGAAYFWPKRPVLAGICVGLLAIKPQMGLLIPFALIASGRWRTIAAAATTVLSLIVLSTIWLGAAIWTDYFRMTQLFGRFIGKGYYQIQQLVVGPYVSLQGAGMPAALAGFLQAVVSVAVLGVIIQVFSQREPHKQDDGRLDLRLALLAAGTLLVTPYSLSYDTPLLILSFIPLLARSWRDGWEGIELASLTALLALPYAQLLAVGSHVPFAFLALLLWFGVLYRRFRRENPAQPAGLPYPAWRSQGNGENSPISMSLPLVVILIPPLEHNGYFCDWQTLDPGVGPLIRTAETAIVPMGDSRPPYRHSLMVAV
ncbi:glycosyltransferase family 87 protein [Bradyrhizobium sp. ARR65]|uniref:glycosyltransferase family 87 protein n=1 Tax=Bradyrhizobium sp. ARR65 TaxID=1040989 RepID=UPI000467D213|nr:glycosyltransferase family 87 protein [Bradyrhizobium sp. ARR65]